MNHVPFVFHDSNETQLQTISAKLDQVLARTNAMLFDLTRNRSSLEAPRENIASIEAPTSTLSVSSLCWIHRILTEGDLLPEAVRGRLRSVQTWVGTADKKEFVPPPPEDVPSRLTAFMEWWRGKHAELSGASKETLVAALAEFHHRLLEIHPFLDANGRVARTLLDQAAHELLNQRITREFISDPPAYFATLVAADRGDLGPLKSRIAASLE